MKYGDLRDFLRLLEAQGELKRISAPVSPVLEMTEICDRVLKRGGPALLFENPAGFDIPVLANLFGTPRRVALGMGQDSVESLREVGKLLAFLKEPDPPKGMRDAWDKLPIFKQVLNMAPKVLRSAPWQSNVLEGPDVDLERLPIQTCWPGDAGPLLTWGLVITRGPERARQNLGIYRQQLIGKNRLIMRWLSHRGGALDFRDWQLKHPGEPFPLAVALGADPATILGAVTPVPDTLSEYAFAGLLRGERTELVKCGHAELEAPAGAEIVLEGYLHPGDEAPEGPFGDHTGYYNAVEPFPVMRLSALTHRRDPLYLSTVTGRPPDEPSVIGEVFNRLTLPVIRAQIPEIHDLWLPPAAASYRIAVVSIHKRYPGQARRVMMALWGMLAQFSYTKLIVVVDADIDVRNWDDIAWALATRMDPARDTMIMEHTPMDYLDFASPEPGLAGKLGLDATTKIGAETRRDWGAVMELTPEDMAFAEALLARQGLVGGAEA